MTIAETLDKRKTKDHFTFEQWLGFLDQVALSNRWKERIVAQTGAECWRDYYDDGYTPYEALQEDCSYA